MGGVSWAEHNKLKHTSDEQKIKIDELEARTAELNLKYEQRKREYEEKEQRKKRDEECLREQKRLAIEDMNNSLKKREIEEISKIEEEFTIGSNLWCVEEIKSIDFNNILKRCFSKLISNENLKKSISENVRNLLKQMINKNQVNHLNLQVIGKTGVGKSTLINAIFGEDLAKVKVGEPCTMETKCYEKSQKYPFLRIYDTRGIEISKDFNIEKVFDQTLEEIKKKCEENLPDELIHCLLYCFTGTRFEREESEILIKLRKTYEGNKLPIILVYTQDLGDDEDDEEIKQIKEAINTILEEKCEETLSNSKKGISLVQVLAKEKKIKKNIKIPPKGLDELIKKCLEKGEYSSKFACLSAVKISSLKKIKEDYTEVEKRIEDEKERYLSHLFQSTVSETEIFEEIIEKIFMTLSLNEYGEYINQENINMLKEINREIITLILEKEDRKFSKLLEEKSRYVSNLLMDEQTNVNKKYDTSFSQNLKNSCEFAFYISDVLKSRLKKISKTYSIHRAAEIVSTRIINYFTENFIEIYTHEINSEDSMTFLHSTIDNCFPNEVKEKILELINDLKNYKSQNNTPNP